MCVDVPSRFPPPLCRHATSLVGANRLSRGFRGLFLPCQLLQKKKAEQRVKEREELKSLSREQQKRIELKEAKKQLKPKMRVKTISG